ncbi:nicotinamide riboside transporter PnuC [Fructobacillus tropaeoli]|uniref:Nicotinamide mononucleotide transporter protein n=1 Tax=Fructobacillus tropaeoli TaxID=709323 RepID=A0A3F3H2B4_9LACO|nr:nicotinamide riboside transporter PnuC [Fructobacillus tropaeoli]GAP05091.1 nicotinamide mononucleotide transporter protein [Fructobacillus tropaeoli]
MKNYVKWLVQEIKSLNTAGAVMLAFMVGVQLALFMVAPITGLSVITLVATLVGSACTVYMMIGKPINGLLGLISALGFIYVNWTAGHYASVLDQLVFVALIDVPLIVTWKSWGHRIINGVKHLSFGNWLSTVALMFIIWIPLIVVYTWLGDTNPVWDSLTLVIGAFASIYVFLGYGDSYTLWLMADVVNIVLWITALSAGYSASSLPMLLTMAFYLMTALYGRFVSVWSK